MVLVVVRSVWHACACVGAYSSNFIDITYLIWTRVVAHCYVIHSLVSACCVSERERGGTSFITVLFIALFNHLIGCHVAVGTSGIHISINIHLLLLM